MNRQHGRKHMGRTREKGAPAESVEARAKRLLRLAPKARKVVGREWFFDNRVEVGYLGETTVCLSTSFENQEHVLDFIEAATPEAVKALALKALAFDAVMKDLSGVPVAFTAETTAAIAKAYAAPEV
jgi:hypothetical protein